MITFNYIPLSLRQSNEFTSLHYPVRPKFPTSGLNQSRRETARRYTCHHLIFFEDRALIFFQFRRNQLPACYFFNKIHLQIRLTQLPRNLIKNCVYHQITIKLTFSYRFKRYRHRVGTNFRVIKPFLR